MRVGYAALAFWSGPDWGESDMIGMVALAVGVAWIGGIAAWWAGMGLWAALGIYAVGGAVSLLLSAAARGLCPGGQVLSDAGVSNRCSAEQPPRSAT